MAYRFNTLLAIFVTTAFVTFNAPLARGTTVGLVGLWEFEDANNIGKATIGNDFTINNSNGTIAAITAIAGTGGVRVGAGDSFTVTHDIPANGTGSTVRVNRYTMVWDFLAPSFDSITNASLVGKYRSFLQTTTTPNGNDADYFLRPDRQLGLTGITYTGATKTVNYDTWYRLVFSADIGQTPSFQTTVIDAAGNVVFTHDHATQTLNGTHALYAANVNNLFHLFSDNGVGASAEDHEIWCANFGLYDRPLSLAEAAALGAPGTAIPEPTGLVLWGLGFIVWARVRRHLGK